MSVSLRQRRTFTRNQFLNFLYIEIGAKDDAFQWLDTAYRGRDPGILALRTDFSVDVLRSDPRYAVLVRKVGLPQ
jgi:hypothetical protein